MRLVLVSVRARRTIPNRHATDETDGQQVLFSQAPPSRARTFFLTPQVDAARVSWFQRQGTWYLCACACVRRVHVWARAFALRVSAVGRVPTHSASDRWINLGGLAC